MVRIAVQRKGPLRWVGLAVVAGAALALASWLFVLLPASLIGAAFTLGPLPLRSGGMFMISFALIPLCLALLGSLQRGMLLARRAFSLAGLLLGIVSVVAWGAAAVVKVLEFGATPPEMFAAPPDSGLQLNLAFWASAGSLILPLALLATGLALLFGGGGVGRGEGALPVLAGVLLFPPASLGVLLLMGRAGLPVLFVRAGMEIVAGLLLVAFGYLVWSRRAAR